MQAHGEMPRASVVDLWGSATLRTGGEEIAQGLALDGLSPDLGHGDRTRHRSRGPARGGHGTASGRRDLADFGTVPRPVPGPDRADRRRGARGRGARGDRRRESARCRVARVVTARRSVDCAHLRHRARSLRCRCRGPAGPRHRPRAARGRVSRCRLARLWRLGGRRNAGVRRLRERGSRPRTCSCIPRKIPRATCWKDRRTSPSSAASPRPRPRSVARPI